MHWRSDPLRERDPNRSALADLPALPPIQWLPCSDEAPTGDDRYSWTRRSACLPKTSVRAVDPTGAPVSTAKSTRVHGLALPKIVPHLDQRCTEPPLPLHGWRNQVEAGNVVSPKGGCRAVRS